MAELEGIEEYELLLRMYAELSLLCGASYSFCEDTMTCAQAAIWWSKSGLDKELPTVDPVEDAYQTGVVFLELYEPGNWYNDEGDVLSLLAPWLAQFEEMPDRETFRDMFHYIKRSERWRAWLFKTYKMLRWDLDTRTDEIRLAAHVAEGYPSVSFTLDDLYKHLVGNPEQYPHFLFYKGVAATLVLHLNEVIQRWLDVGCIEEFGGRYRPTDAFVKLFSEPSPEFPVSPEGLPPHPYIWEENLPEDELRGEDGK
jgi:hypothetical protein